MRTEELLKESYEFNRERSAYIHAQLFNGDRGAVIVAGENPAIVITIYNIIEAFCQNMLPDDASFKDLVKEMKKCLKALKALLRLTTARGEPMFERSELDET